MRMFKYCVALFVVATIATTAAAHINPNAHGIPTVTTTVKNTEVSMRAACSKGKTQTDMAVNNVRARLLTSGDVWWDGRNGRYIVPKVPAGVPEVSSIFAGGVWIGGKDQGGNLKVAASTFPNATSLDWWPGPLDPTNGTVTETVCKNWDRQFKVTGANIDKFRKAYNAAPKDPIDKYTVLDAGFLGTVPEDVLGWPSKGNKYFADIAGFSLPDTDQGLAYFFDNNGDGDYDPNTGDYPVIYVKGCNTPQYPDEMIFWIYNDAGGAHTESGGIPIRMEVQVQSFAYSTNDELNNMTFMAYRLVNRAAEDIKETYFAVWTDPDLGCYQDDYVGCDTTVVPTLRGPRTRDLMYIYNQDKTDGINGCTCLAVNTYCNDVPIMGIDYFRGPSDPDKLVKDPISGKLIPKEIGMSSFMYYNNGAVGNPPSATTDPAVVEDFYNYLKGNWKGGVPLTNANTGYNPGNTDPKVKQVKYAFYDAPDKVGGWSMFQGNAAAGDRRTLQASGPFRLTPGAVNELIVGVPWVASQGGGNVSLADLQRADDKAQELFDKCFKITNGPDSPDLDIIEMNNELVLTLTNDKTSNNFTEYYGAVGAPDESLEFAPGGPGQTDHAKRYYGFQGYKIYQLSGPEVGTNAINDPTKASLVFQCDIRDGVKKIYNWSNLKDPNNPSEPVFEPNLQVSGADAGVVHTFRIKEDQFAKGESKKLINHKKYYFTAVAYAHNEFAKFDKKGLGAGQQYPYIGGRRNNRVYTAIPRPIVTKTVLAAYGDGAIITRLDGVGTGTNFLDMSDETAKAILDGTFDGKIVYKAGRGPINVKIYNPIDVKDGKFELTFVDEDMANTVLDKKVGWVLKDLTTGKIIKSETTIEKLNEQLLGDYGFSIGIAQVPDAGFIKANPLSTDKTNGVIGSEIEYQDKNNTWFGFVNSGGSSIPALNGNSIPVLRYIFTAGGEVDEKLDPDGAFNKINDKVGFAPYHLCSAAPPGGQIPFNTTPSWVNASNSTVRLANDMKNLNNVDIVFTSDKSKWSRCVVVESATSFYTQGGLVTQDNLKQFDVRERPSVSKEDANGDNLPDPDGSTVSVNGKDYKTGFAWFPGYAIDVETGTRLNIFFGENSVFRPENTDLSPPLLKDKSQLTGADMTWNPSALTFFQGILDGTAVPAGCQHYIYVTSKKYDECKELRGKLDKSLTSKVSGLRDVQWAGFPILPSALVKLKSYKDGLIPTDTKVKLRVNNPYATVDPAVSADKKGYPTYQFEFKGKKAQELVDAELIKGALDEIRVVPNPYFAYSDYENSQFSNVVKITNLPAKCTVSIYTLDGQFIRQYKRDEQGTDLTKGRSNPGIPITQITPALEWDVKNSKGIPIASGTYLIHIQSDLGDRTIKWYGVQRPFDPSGL